jgi:aminopeptidase N
LEPLVTTSDELFYRLKAMRVWWMLRDMVGDAPLQRALHNYKAQDDREPSYMQRLIEAETLRKLEWFFDDWVYRDRGLPDFRIEAVYPRPLVAGGYTLTITVENRGEAGAEVPVMVETSHGQVMRRLEVRGRDKAVIRIEVPEAPKRVVVNDGSVPEVDRENNSVEVKLPAK